MSRIVFGEVLPCLDCEGSGHALSMNEADKRERSRQLRIAKRRKEPPPAIVHRTCDTCNGTGLLTTKGKYV